LCYHHGFVVALTGALGTALSAASLAMTGYLVPLVCGDVAITEFFGEDAD
jgi:hypothetical protein